MTALLRYQTALLLRSNRWIFPLIAYGALIAVGAAASTPLAEGLDWSAAMLVPAVAFITRSMLVAEPDASRARSPRRPGRPTAPSGRSWPRSQPRSAAVRCSASSAPFSRCSPASLPASAVFGVTDRITATIDHPACSWQA